MKRYNFNFNMARGNHVVLSGWLVLHAFWMPMLSSELMRRFPDVMGVVEYNIIYYLISTIVVLLFGWHYLRRDFDVLMDNGFGTIVMLLRAFFNRLHGYHVQYNVVSRETLLDAQQHPEKHRDLIVRVAGYSALFTTLSKSLQDDIINRTEQGMF